MLNLQFNYPVIEWTFFRKLLFRLGFTFIFLTLFPFPIDTLLPFFTWPSEKITEFYNFLIPIIGKHLLNIDYPIDLELNGSGDKTKDYVAFFIQLLFASIATIIWSILDRKRLSYNKLFYWFIVLCRYYLAFTMFGYGFAKVFKLQMGALSLGQLVQPIGEQSPMGMAWNFVGFSDLYCRFSGWAEVVSGILLVFSRTAILGGIVSFVVLFHVMLLNFSFDIPVKIYSTFLVIISLCILSPYYKRIFGVFFSSKFVNTQEQESVFKKVWQHRTALVFKYLVVIYVFGTSYYNNYAQSLEYGEKAPKPPLYGIYETKLCIKNNDTINAYGDTTAWKRMVFNWSQFTSVLKYNDKKMRLKCAVDTLKHTVLFTNYSDTTKIYTFQYKQVNDTMYQFNGMIEKDTFAFISQRKTRTNFLLYNRGFHWVNEFPFNR